MDLKSCCKDFDIFRGGIVERLYPSPYHSPILNIYTLTLEILIISDKYLSVLALSSRSP